MKKFVWLMAGAMAVTNLFAQDAPAPAQTNSVAATNAAASSSTKKASTSSAKKSEKKSADKKKSAPAAKTATAAPEKPIVLVPGPGTISGDHVNVRGQATFVGEIVKRLNKGDSVTVIEQVIRDKPKPDEPSQWAKIGYPAGANVWIHSTYVSSTNTVIPKKLNVRAGPGENYSVVGKVAGGAPVKEISRKGNWVEIEAPADSYAFVAAKFIKQEGKAHDVPTVVTIAEPVKEPPTPPVPPPPQPETTTLSNPPPVVATTTDDTTNPIPNLVIEDISKPAPPPEDPPPPRIVSHEGVVRPTVSIQAPTKYEIWEPKTRMSINYLHSTSTNLNLSLYRGLRIIVTGEEELDERWKNTPVIKIQKIQVVE
jgi:uncharacterized protein YgiM (DUF1202 family)